MWKFLRPYIESILLFFPLKKPTDCFSQNASTVRIEEFLNGEIKKFAA